MVVLNRIYTRTGDAGTTRLATGEPVSKAGPRIAANGDVDELNACLGLVRLHTAGDALDAIIARIQNELFDLGADLSTPERTCVALAAVETVEAESLKYLNRLSDLLFVAARAANSNGAGDVLWVPGATR